MAPNRAFQGESLRLLLSQAFDQGANSLDVRYRIGIERYHIVEVSSRLFSILNHLIDHLNERPRQSASALRHDEPLLETRGCAVRCEGDGILVRLNLVG